MGSFLSLSLCRVFPQSRAIGLAVALIAVCATGCSPGASAPPEAKRESDAAAEEWIPLFDGATLDGWANPYAWGEAWAAGGVIHLRADDKFFLITDTTYRDFVFEGQVRLPDRASNSGFMFRANVEPNRVYGYQAEVDPSKRAWSGGLYDEGRRGWIHPPPDDSGAGQAFRSGPGQAFDPGQWNAYRIRAVGDSLTIWVNGTMTTALRDTMDREGVIGIQHHGEDGKIYRFRSLRLRPLNAVRTDS
jgi:hypothetical protein